MAQGKREQLNLPWKALLLGYLPKLLTHFVVAAWNIPAIEELSDLTQAGVWEVKSLIILPCAT